MDRRSTLWWMNMHDFTTPCTIAADAVGSSFPTSMSDRKYLATEVRASSGHSANQSIVQQLTREGNMRSRCRNASPTGEKQSTTCKLAWTRLTYWAKIACLVMGMLAACMMGRMTAPICSRSSLPYRFGTSPEFRMLLMSSRNASCTIWVSVKRNTTSCPSFPAFIRAVLRSSFHSVIPYPLAISIW